MGRTIETKESQERACSTGMQSISHNNVLVVQNQARFAALNPFTCSNGTGDAMDANNGTRIGDQITLKGLSVKMMLENPVDRSNVYYRIMLIKCAKGDTIDRTTPFKNDSANKLMDVINTERFTIIAQKIVNLKTSNAVGVSVGLTGIPAAATNAGIATKLVTMWISGSKFGKNGNVQYENLSAAQVKFYDYRFVMLCYDWNGTPQDINAVGKLNDLIAKMYFKDA